MKLPTYTENKQTGNRAADYLKSILQKFAIVNVHDESIDLGIDMRAQLVENSIPKEMYFNVQCKGTKELEVTESKDYYSVPIKVSTINYWSIQNETTFLFLVELTENSCYWCNPLTQFNDNLESIQNHEKVTIRVPKSNFLDIKSEKLPIEFKNYIPLYLVKRVKKFSDITKKINDGIKSHLPLTISQTVEILEILMIEFNKVQANFYEISDALILNIKENLSKSRNLYHQLDYIPCVNQYCKKGIYDDTGFSSDGSKTLREIFSDIDTLIDQYEKNLDNIELLKEIEKIDAESKSIYNNLLYFLYEMVCEDNPFGDHTELKMLIKKEEESKIKYLEISDVL